MKMKRDRLFREIIAALGAVVVGMYYFLFRITFLMITSVDANKESVIYAFIIALIIGFMVYAIMIVKYIYKNDGEQESKSHDKLPEDFFTDLHDDLL